MAMGSISAMLSKRTAALLMKLFSAEKILKRNHKEMVIGFATLVENKDGSTGGHIKRTSTYVKLLAEELKKLVEFYNQVKDKGNFELIFVSCDRDKNAMMDYMKKYNMPFLAAPHRDPVAQALMRDLGVRGIPTLAVFAPDGKLITKNGRSDVMKNGAKALENWESQCK